MSRFREPQHPLFTELNRSAGFDWRLAPYDIALSRAHVRMLAATGVLSSADRDAIHEALGAVESEFEHGTFEFLDTDEDIHMAIERRVTALVGHAGARIHTARSRNDQVATGLALWLRAHSAAGAAACARLEAVLLAKAEEHLDWALPGYTHLQRAQPVYLSHHLLAWFWMIHRDRKRFLAVEQASRRAMPLGSGALAGVNFDTDRRMVAAELGFDGISENSIDAVADRDVALELLSAQSICATHLSRFGSELVIWSSQEFGFCEMSDAWSSGSSIMPQKKNPDVPELARGKTGRVVGHLMALLMLMKAQPLAYNKDNQEDKEPLFDTADTVSDTLLIFIDLVAGMMVNKDRMRQAAGRGFATATDLADYLVRKGMPFRDAHEAVASAVREADQDGVDLSALPLARLKRYSNLIEDDVYQVLGLDGSLAARNHLGGTAPEAVRAAINRHQQRLATNKA